MTFEVQFYSRINIFDAVKPQSCALFFTHPLLALLSIRGAIENVRQKRYNNLLATLLLGYNLSLEG